MLTTHNNIFRCECDVAAFVAECANLREEEIPAYYKYRMWQDQQTGGGGARIVWSAGIAWVSRHAGYPQADIVEEVSGLFVELGCKAVMEWDAWHRNPHIYPQ